MSTQTQTPMERADAAISTAMSIMEQMKAAGEANNLEDMVKLAGELTKAQESATKLRKEAMGAEIAQAEHVLVAGITALIGNADWKRMTGEDITTLVFYQEEGVDGQPPVFAIQVNPKTKTRRKGPGTGNRKGTRASVEMNRINPDTGEVETLTVKEVVQTYASDKIRGQALYAKSAWSLLFTKVNGELPEGYQFEEVAKAPVAENTEVVEEVQEQEAEAVEA